MDAMKCKECGVEFVPRTYWQEFHTAQCRVNWWVKEKKRALELVRQQETRS